MARFLVESYLPAGSRDSLAADAARLRAAADEVGDVRLLQTLYVPSDEVCFFLFESDRAESVAGLGFDRVQPVVALDEL